MFLETQNCMHDMLLLLLSCSEETVSRLVYQKNSEYRCYVDIVVVTWSLGKPAAKQHNIKHKQA